MTTNFFYPALSGYTHPNTMPTLIKPSRLFTNELLDQYRQQGDAPADAVISALVTAAGPAGLRALMGWLADPSNASTIDQHPAVGEFFGQYAHLPSWADPDRMKRGMVFFQKHTRQISLTLGLFSLPYSYLGAKGAQVLWLTERIKNDTARRLQETGDWVFAVNNPKEWTSAPVSLRQPERGDAGTTAALFRDRGGAGRETNAIIRTLKVRLIHAGARWFSLHSGRWNHDWGYPVNQEDMAGTNLAFSYIVLLGLRQAGVSATEQEEEDYLHHINVVGYLNGVAEELLPQNLREAYTLGHAIARRQFASSEAGIGLTRALLDTITRQIVQQSASPVKDRPETIRNLMAGAMRSFMGDQHADWLKIPDAPVEKRLAGLVSRLPIFSNQ